MKTRSASTEAPNIAAIVKARHNARVIVGGCDSFSGVQHHGAVTPTSGCESSDFGYVSNDATTAMISAPCEETKPSIDDKPKSRSDGTPRLLRGTLSPDDRRLFFQAVRLYGRNFTEITRFIRSRGHRISSDVASVGGSWTGCGVGDHNAAVAGNSFTPTTTAALLTSPHYLSLGVQGTPTTLSQMSSSAGAACTNITSVNAPTGGRTREQIRFFYQQTWHKIRRYIKFPEAVPQHVREVYALVNYSVMRTRIKKPLDHRLGEKLNELVNCGTTVIKHNGRRYLLRTPVCQALKQLNHIAAPTHEFLLPEDVWVEMVPRSQADLWRVIESEQNPRLRLRVDINRQLSDIIGLVENKWQLAAERLQTLFELNDARKCERPCLQLIITPSQAIDGAIRLQEVARIRSCDLALRAYISRNLPEACVPSSSGGAPPSSTAPGASVSVPPSSTSDPNSGESLPPVTTCEDPVESMQPTSINTVSSPVSVLNSQATGSNPSTSSAGLDLRELGKQLSQGVTYETARGIKVLTIFLALGCPDRIRFEYRFVCKRGEQSDSRTNAYSGLLTYQPTDPDGYGISNGLRRLLHLNASDYLLHRDWVARQGSGPFILPKQTTSAGAVPPSQGQPSLVSLPRPVGGSSAASQTPLLLPKPPNSTSTNPTSMLVPLPAVLGPDESNNALATLNGSILRVSSTVNAAQSVNPTIAQPVLSVSSAGPISQGLTSVSSSNSGAISGPNIFVLPKPSGHKGVLAIVERQLDVERNRASALSESTPPTFSGVATSSTKQGTFIPPAANSLRTTAVNRCTPNPSVSIASRPTGCGVTPATVASPRQSSLNAVRAFNIRRRTNSLARGGNSRVPGLASSLLPNLSHQTSISVLASRLTATGQKGMKTEGFVDGACPSLPRVHPIAIQNMPTLTPAPFQTTDTDTSLNLPMDPNASNMSSVSLLSTDTLASLLNTIGHPSTDEPANFAVINAISNGATSDMAPAAPSVTTTLPQPLTYKWEEVDSVLGRTDWDEESKFDFAEFGRPYPSSFSTPHPPPASPAFGEISLTDSMAAAVLDTHNSDVSIQRNEENSANPGTSATNSDLSGGRREIIPGLVSSSASSSLTIDPISTVPGSNRTPNEVLRMVIASSPERTIVDLNSLLLSMNSPFDKSHNK
ncbi:unnamed protein product [Calicophoron daubneyi]|uniref:Protein cramped n=1 Tax=Calicophoron daubneyi TaxID=300641 RepID=A0AAV2T0I0_CALDB